MAQQNVHFGDDNNSVQFVYGNDIANMPLYSGNDIANMPLYSGTWGSDMTGNILSHGMPYPPSNPVNDSEGRDDSSSSTSEFNSRNRKKSGGRPKKVPTFEELQKYKGYTIEVAAAELKVGRTTLQRHLQKVTGYKTWSEFQKSMTGMQPEDKVPINIEHKGKIIPFNLPSPAIWKELQKRIKNSLKLKAETYDIKYSNGEQDLYIICNDSLKSCLDRADGTSIVLKVVERI